MSSTRAPDFSRLAATYDVVRPVDANWWEVYELLEKLADLRGRRVLDVGCGTGRLSFALAERAGAKVWGVDASPEMLTIARAKAPRGVAFKEAHAESLPFKDAWFERVVLWLVVHLVERRVAFAEARRVLSPSGRIAVVSFDPSHFDSYWLNEYMPSLERIDRARFPTGAELVSQLTAAGFVDVETVRIDQSAELTRADALLKLRAQHISTLQLVDRDEYERGVAEAARTLPDAIAVDLNWLVATGTAA